MKHDKHQKMESFLYGYASYLVLIWLLSQKEFKASLPISFFVPCRLEDGDCHFYDVLQYMLLPCKSMLSIVKHDQVWLYHLLRVVVKFIETWLGLFPVGPALQPNLLVQLHSDILQGVTQYVTRHVKHDSTSSSSEDVVIKPKKKKYISSSLSSSTSSSSDKNTLVYKVPQEDETSSFSFVQRGVHFHLPKHDPSDTDQSSSISVLNNKINYHVHTSFGSSTNDDLVFYHSSVPSSTCDTSVLNKPIAYHGSSMSTPTGTSYVTSVTPFITSANDDLIFYHSSVLSPTTTRDTSTSNRFNMHQSFPSSVEDSTSLTTHNLHYNVSSTSYDTHTTQKTSDERLYYHANKTDTTDVELSWS